MIHEKEIKEAFVAINEGVKQYLPSICDQATAEEICREAQEELAMLIPQLPEIGDKNAELDEGLGMIAICIAYYKAFGKQNMPVEALGKMLYDLRAYQFSVMSEEEKKAFVDDMFSAERLKGQKEWAVWSLKFTYPDNWAAAFVAGNDSNFDYGMDYVECGVAKTCHKFGADKLVPFICLMDLLESNLLGLGLERTKTLADGDHLCDFRFKRGRLTNRSWDTEIEGIRKLISNPSYEPVLKGHF